METVKAIVHSQQDKGPQDCELIDKAGDNDYIVRTPDGVVCHAIYNPFSGLFYAGDIYAIDR